MSIRIIVVDDHTMFRAGVVEMLMTVPDFQVIAEGSSAVEAITLAHELLPDVAVLDLEMPGPGVKAMVRRVLDASPSTRIVILTMHDDPAVVRELLDAGASGYLLKTAGRSELVAAIKSASGTDESVLLAVSRKTALSLARSQLGEPEVLSPGRSTSWRCCPRAAVTARSPRRCSSAAAPSSGT